MPGQPPPARVYYHHMCTEAEIISVDEGHFLSDICSVDLLTAGRRVSLWGSVTSPGCQAAADSIQAFLIIPRSFAATPGPHVLLALPGRLVSHTTRAVVLEALLDSTRPNIICGCLLVYLWGSSGSARDYALPVRRKRWCRSSNTVSKQQQAARGVGEPPSAPDTAFPHWIVTWSVSDWDRQSPGAEGVAGGASLPSPQYFTCPTRERARRAMRGLLCSTSGYGILYQASMPLKRLHDQMMHLR